MEKNLLAKSGLEGEKMKIIKKDENTCYIINDYDITKLKVTNSDLFIEIANNILSNKDKTNYIEPIYQEVQKLLPKSKDAMTHLKIYSNCSDIKESILIQDNIPSICKEDSLKVFFLEKISPKTIKETFMDINLENAVVILDIDYYYIISHFITKQSPCIACLIDRWLESQDDTYLDLDLYDLPFTIDASIGVKEFAIEIAKNNIKKREERVFLLDKRLLTVSTSNIYSMPGCKRCEMTEMNFANFELSDKECVVKDNGFRQTTAYDSKKILSKYVNILGPITSIKDCGELDKLDTAVFQSYISHDFETRDFCVHGGKGMTQAQAELSAMGEAMERYNARFFKYEELLMASYNDLKGKQPTLNPHDLVLDCDYPYPYSDDKKIEWVPSKCLNDNKTVLVPANSVFFVYTPVPKEKQFIPQDTTGLSSGLSIEESVLQGALEVIERDACAIYYRTQMQCDYIDISNTTNSELKNLYLRLLSKNIKIHLKYLKTDLDLYVFHCTTEDVTNCFPIYTHGAGASCDPYIAATRAITECIQLRSSQIKLKQKNVYKNNIKCYIPYYEWGIGNKNYVGNFIINEEDIAFDIDCLKNYSSGSILKDINYLISQLNQIGLKMYVVNLSRPDNEIRTVRVIIPGMQTSEDNKNRKSRRLFELPRKLNKQVQADYFDKVIFS